MIYILFWIFFTDFVLHQVEIPYLPVRLPCLSVCSLRASKIFREDCSQGWFMYRSNECLAKFSLTSFKAYQSFSTSASSEMKSLEVLFSWLWSIWGGMMRHQCVQLLHDLVVFGNSCWGNMTVAIAPNPLHLQQLHIWVNLRIRIFALLSNNLLFLDFLCNI